MTLPAPPADAGPDILCSELVRIFTAQGVEVQALQGLELRVERGEMVALVGASGSGKSTLLTILAGLDNPTAGRAQVAGHDLVTMRGAERLRYQRSSVGFVWQQSARNLLPYLSAAENIGMAHAVAGVVPRPRRRAVADELLELLGVADVSGRRPDQLSGGQKQRVAIAVSLANDPRVLLADEPTGELDFRTGVQVLDLLHQQAHTGRAVVVVSHNREIARVADRVVELSSGHVVRDGEPEGGRVEISELRW